jgi:hypothetical protein
MSNATDDAVRRVNEARLRAAIEETVPDDPHQRRVFVDWILDRLYAAAPDKAAFVRNMEKAVAHAMAYEARERGRLQ